MKPRIRALGAVVLALLPATTSLAKKPPAEPMGPASKAVTNEIVDAVAEEMDRAMKRLEIPGAPKPYQISYKITEVEANDAVASLGATTTRRVRHFVNLEARVRVGSPQLDNSNFVVPDGGELDGTAQYSFPLEATPRIARRAAWLVTDQAYKEALIQLRAKLEARRAGGTTHPSDVPAWTDTKKVVSEEPILVPPLETLDELEARAKKLSALFRDQPDLRDSRVALTSYLERRWYLTTEGTSATDTRRASGIVISVSGQAPDGQLLGNYFMRYGHTGKDLPSDKDLEAEAKELGKSISALVKAPVTEAYSGPVLFEGEGAVGVVRFTLSPQLGGTPLPEGISPNEAKQYGGALTDKIGKRVTSPNISVTDDPTARDAATKPLIGGYKIDDEGTAAEKVEIIKSGMLKTLLLSRTPSAKGQVSNGHARCCSVSAPADGGAFHGSATNLMVTGSGTTPRKALYGKLIAAAKAEGLKYGLIIKRFDDAAITGAPEFTRRELIQMIRATNQQLPPPAALAYRLYPDGKQELVRGVQLAEVPMRAWKDVLGVSKETTVYNFLNATENQLQLRLTGGTDDGLVPSGGIESSITTPDLLLKEIDVSSSLTAVRPSPSTPRPAK